MATHTYRPYNNQTGMALSAPIPGILASVALTAVETTSGSNIVEVATTTGLFPFMGLSVPNIPLGAFILAIKSATEIVAAAQLLNVATGEWTVTPANANATANGTGMLGRAHGFNPSPIVEAISDANTYRNQWDLSLKSPTLRFTAAPNLTMDGLITGGYIPTPEAAIAQTATYVTVAGGLVKVSDQVAGVPPRNLTKWQSYWYLIAADGMVTKIPVSPEIEIIRTGTDTV